MDVKTLKTIQSNFLHELQAALSGKKTSLPFIIHKLSPSPIVRNGEVFQTFVIGGTVAKIATVKKKGSNIEILDSKQYHVSFKSEQDFLSFFDYKIHKDIGVIALNFAYPMTPVFENGRLDGELLAIPKEGTFHGLIGKKIGQEIEVYIFKKRKKVITVSVANDTICLLLSGLTKYPWNKLAAGIVGTGLNFAFFLDKDRLVNLESANFDKFNLTQEAKIIDKESREPNKHLFEKETAGAYLYKHFNIIIKDRKINYSPINSTEELNRISLNRGYSSSEARYSTVPGESRSNVIPAKAGIWIPDQVGNDRVSSRQARTITNDVNHKTSEIAMSLLTRSAQLVACQIAGILRFAQNDKNNGRGMVFNMEGSLFWKGNGYKETVEKTVTQLVPNYKVRFIEIKESGILGAAKLVS